MRSIRRYIWLLLIMAFGTYASSQSLREKSVALARQELSGSLDVEEHGVVLLKVRPVDWSDSSLGCPLKGVSYAQVIVPGFLIHLSARGSVYAAHVGGDRVVICRSPRQHAARDDLEVRRSGLDMIQRAHTDLENRLEIDSEQVRLIKAERGSWPDTSLGCPKKGEEYLEIPRRGLQIEFLAQDRTHLYHSDMKRLVYCGQQIEPVG